MTIRRPSVEWEHSAKHTETNERHWEEVELPFVRNGIVLSHFEEVHGEVAVGRRMIVDTENAKHQECRATHQHQCKFHCRVVLVARTPYTDKEVHRNKSHLVEHKHGEEVNRDEETKHTNREEEEPHEELARQWVDFP